KDIETGSSLNVNASRKQRPINKYTSLWFAGMECIHREGSMLKSFSEDFVQGLQAPGLQPFLQKGRDMPYRYSALYNH
ncbi:unnamed protein product, partial [Ceratitis capitata]